MSKRKFLVNLIRCEQCMGDPIYAESYKEAEEIALDRHSNDTLTDGDVTDSWDNHIELLDDESADDWQITPICNSAMVWQTPPRPPGTPLAVKYPLCDKFNKIERRTDYLFNAIELSRADELERLIAVVEEIYARNGTYFKD